MSKFELPKPVRLAGLLFLALIAVGVFQAIAGALELNHLSANAATLEEKATMYAQAKVAADRMGSSASLAMWCGGIGATVFLLFRPLFVRGYAWTRIAAWVLVLVFMFGQVLLMLQDGSIGVRPYSDMAHDLAQETLVNGLIIWPGYFFMLYPAEAAGLILPPILLAQLLKEETFEFFRLRKRVTADKSWDVAEILAKRAKG